MNWQDGRDCDAARAPAARGHRACWSRSRSRPAGRVARSAVSIVAVTAAAAAAVWLFADGYAAHAVPGPVLGRSDRARSARRSCSRSRCPCCSSRATNWRNRHFHILLLSSLYGVCLMLSSDSFLTLFLGIELMSLPVYVLVLLAFRRPESAEAALKYLVLGGTATATLLMGASLLYGASGSLALATFADALGSPDHAWRASASCSSSSRSSSRPRSCRSTRGRRTRTRAPRSGDRVHGDDRQGGRAARRGAPVRHRAAVAADGRPGRDAAARVDRLGQPRGDAPAELPPDDRLLVDRARGLSLLRVPRRGPGTLPGGGVLRARLRGDERPRFRVASARRRRRGARPARQPQGTLPPRPVRRADDRHRHALARGPAAASPASSPSSSSSRT